MFPISLDTDREGGRQIICALRGEGAWCTEEGRCASGEGFSQRECVDKIWTLPKRRRQIVNKRNSAQMPTRFVIFAINFIKFDQDNLGLQLLRNSFNEGESAVLIPVFDGRKFKIFTSFLLKSNLTHQMEIVLQFTVTYARFNPLNPFLIKSSTEILPKIPDFDVHSNQNNC